MHSQQKLASKDNCNHAFRRSTSKWRGPPGAVNNASSESGIGQPSAPSDSTNSWGQRQETSGAAAGLQGDASEFRDLSSTVRVRLLGPAALPRTWRASRSRSPSRRRQNLRPGPAQLRGRFSEFSAAACKRLRLGCASTDLSWSNLLCSRHAGSSSSWGLHDRCLAAKWPP